MNVFIDPPVFVDILQAGWKEYIPLNSLTNDACAAASRDPTALKKTLYLENGLIKLTSTALDPSGEELMTPQQILEAYPRFVRGIRLYYGVPKASKIADAFQTHFDNLRARSEFRTKTHLIMEYDITIRRRHA